MASNIRTWNIKCPYYYLNKWITELAAKEMSIEGLTARLSVTLQLAAVAFLVMLPVVGYLHQRQHQLLPSTPQGVNLSQSSE